MESNDYIGSFAQENVLFQTTVVSNSSYGDNFKRVMVFSEKGLITDLDYLVGVEGSDTIKVATVKADDYASVTKGILQSWLTDLFANGETEEAYIVINGDDSLDTEKMTEAYELLKAYAYWKTVCIGSAGDSTTDPVVPADPSILDDTRFNTLAAALAPLCQADKQVLSGPVLAPLSTTNATNFATDARYTALKDKYVFMSYHQDTTRNAALYAVGLALSYINDSGTPVGNSLDMPKSNSITSNNLKRPIRQQLNAANIQTWKKVGNNSAYVAAETDVTLKGDVISADWIVAYVTYMSKVDIAVMITSMNYYRSAANYTAIVNTVMGYIGMFVGRLKNIVCTAPAFGALPKSASDELVIPNAWQATYVDHIRKVTIGGTLYIGG